MNQPAENERTVIASTCIGTGLSFILIGVLAGTLRFWSTNGFDLFPSGKYSFLAALPLIGVGLYLGKHNLKKLYPHPVGFGFGILLLFFSDWLARGYNFLQAPLIRGEILIGCLVVLVGARRFKSAFFLSLLALASCLLMYSFFGESHGRLLFSDDHATFIYRLSLLRDFFPSIPFYSPLWNGGIDARDFFATGALNVFFLGAPLFYLFSVEATYNIVVALILFILLPGSVYYASRLEKHVHGASAVSAILALTNGLIWYRWALKYGTIGFATSTALVPLTIVLFGKILARDRFLSPAEAALFVISFTLMLFWSLSGLALIPLAILFVWDFLKDLGTKTIRTKEAPRLLRKKFVPLALSLIIAINVPWICLFLSSSKVKEFLHVEKNTATASLNRSEGLESPDQEMAARTMKSSPKKVTLSSALTKLREASGSTNPLIVLFLIPGIFLLRGPSRAYLGLTCLWLLFLGTVAAPLKPQLEIDRMLVVLAVLAAIPAGRAIWEMFECFHENSGAWGLVPCVITGGFLCASPFAASGILHNRTVEQYYFENDLPSAMAAAINEYGGEGRVLFTGFILHEVSHGHLAPLALRVKNPLMASSQFHDQWKYRQIFPEDFLVKGPEGIEEYLDTYNVTAVFAHEPKMREYFLSRPEKYSNVWHEGSFLLFTRKTTPSYFLSGSGEIISQHGNGVEVKVNSSEAVLKFNYFPFLTASSCQLEPAQIEKSVTLVKLSHCSPGATITIRSVSPFARLMGS